MSVFEIKETSTLYNVHFGMPHTRFLHEKHHPNCEPKKMQQFVRIRQCEREYYSKMPSAISMVTLTCVLCILQQNRIDFVAKARRNKRKTNLYASSSTSHAKQNMKRPPHRPRYHCDTKWLHCHTR